MEVVGATGPSVKSGSSLCMSAISHAVAVLVGAAGGKVLPAPEENTVEKEGEKPGVLRTRVAFFRTAAQATARSRRKSGARGCL